MEMELSIFFWNSPKPQINGISILMAPTHKLFPGNVPSLKTNFRQKSARLQKFCIYFLIVIS